MFSLKKKKKNQNCEFVGFFGCCHQVVVLLSLLFSSDKFSLKWRRRRFWTYNSLKMFSGILASHVQRKSPLLYAYKCTITLNLNCVGLCWHHDREEKKKSHNAWKLERLQSKSKYPHENLSGCSPSPSIPMKVHNSVKVPLLSLRKSSVEKGSVAYAVITSPLPVNGNCRRSPCISKGFFFRNTFIYSFEVFTEDVQVYM